MSVVNILNICHAWLSVGVMWVGVVVVIEVLRNHV